MKPSISGFRFCLLAGLVLWVWLAGGALAQEPPVATVDPAKVAEQQEARRQALEDDRASIARLRETLFAQSTDLSRRLSSLRVEDVTEAMADQARLDTQAVRLRRKDLEADIVNTERRIKELEQIIRDLEAREQLLQNPAREGEDAAQRAEQLVATRQTLTQQRAELALEKRHLQNLRDRLELVSIRLSLVEQWQSRIEELYRLQQERSRQEAQENLETRLQKERQTYLERAAQLSRRLEREGDFLPLTRRQWLETELRRAEEQANLAQLDIRLADLENALARLDSLAAKAEAQPEELREGLKQLRDLQRELQTTGEIFQQKQNLFRQQQQVIERREPRTDAEQALNADEKRTVSAMLADLEAFHDRVMAQQQDAEAIGARLNDHYKTILRRHLLAHQTPPTTLAEWKQLFAGIAGVPGVLLYQVRLSFESTLKSIADAAVPRWAGLAAAELGLVIMMALGWRGLARLRAVLGTAEEIGFSNRVVHYSTELLRRNALGVGFAAALLIAVRIFEVPQPGQGIIVTLTLLGIGVKMAVDLAWLVLASPLLPAERYRPTLYRHWFWTLIVGGVVAAMTILAHLSGVTGLVRDAFDWMFMLYLLLVIPAVLRARGFFVDLLALRYAGQRWFRGLRLLSFLLPLSVFVTGALGVVGYLNLAWTVAWYLVLSIAVLVVWLAAQGLLSDLATVVKGYAARQTGELSMWPQEIIDPLYKVIGILLFLGACTVLVRVYGWDEDATIITAWQFLFLAVVAVAAAYEMVYFLAGHVARRTKSVLGTALVRHSRQPLGVMLLLGAAQLIVSRLPVPAEALDPIRHVLVLLQIAAVSWLVIRLTSVMEDVVVHRYMVEAENKLSARRIRTQTRLLRQIVLVSVYLIGISAMLMTFPKVRQLGAGLLASAGVVGLVVGIAARPFLANLIAGIQIGLTQPIRLDDEVIVEGEWGRISEINPTHVIIHIWDDRRLVVPLNYFNEKPFENWTRTSTNLIGTVFIYVDYTFPVEEGRKELKRILETTDLWDGRVEVLHVTDTKNNIMELRLLVSARDAPTAWDLRCYVREKFIEFVQKHYPQCLPRPRATLLREKIGVELSKSAVSTAPKKIDDKP